MATFGTSSNTYTVHALKPGTEYAAQIQLQGYVANDGSGVGGTYSPALIFTTDTDTTPPDPVTNLVAVEKNRSIIITWDAPALNSDGEELVDLTGYEIIFYPTGDSGNSHTIGTTETEWELTRFFQQSVLGNVFDDITFEVRAIDLGGNKSTPVSVQFQAVGISPFTITGLLGDISITLEWIDQATVNYYSIHRAVSSGFTPSNANQIGALGGSDDNVATQRFIDTPESDTTYYYQVKAYSWFGSTEISNEVSGSTQGVLSGPDTDAPSTANAPNLTGGTHEFTVSYDLTQSDGVTPIEDNSRFVFVYASDTTSFTADEDTLLGSMAIGDNTLVKDTFTWVIAQDTETVYVKIRVGNKDGYTGPASAEASTVVNGAGTEYIQDLAVTNAKIQTLSASKLIADSTFTNDLFVESQFTINTAGIMQTSGYVGGGENGGWRIDGTGLAEFQNAIIYGTIFADNGTLSNLTILDVVTVGDNATGTGNSIQSYDYAAGTDGWIIRGDGYSEFSEIVARGAIYADSGTLNDLTVIGTITVGPGASRSIESSNYVPNVSGWAIDGDGTAEFQDVKARGEIIAESGYINGDFYVNDDLYLSGAGGTFSTHAPNEASATRRVRIDQNDYLKIYGPDATDWDDGYWQVYTSDQNNFLIEEGTGFDALPNSSVDRGMAVLVKNRMTLRFRAYKDAVNPTTLFIRVGDFGSGDTEDWSIGTSNADDLTGQTKGFMTYLDTDTCFAFTTSPLGNGSLLNIKANQIEGETVIVNQQGGFQPTLDATAAPTNIDQFSQTVSYKPDGSAEVDVVIQFDEPSNGEYYETRITRV